jgi:transcriptional regulator with XRE-family HTH domain
MRKDQAKNEVILEALGGAIQERRLRLGISQQELADQSDLHRTYISDIESGARNLSITTLLRIAAALDTTPSRLLKLSEKKAESLS